MLASQAIRAGAWTVVVAGIAAPLVRRRLGLAPVAVTAISAAAPFGLCIAIPRTKRRDVGTCLLQMWAYIATYQMPNDDPDALKRRVYIDYPVRVDRALGLGRTPTLRLQRALATPGCISRRDEALIWVHWLWFLIPHSALIYILVRRHEQFERAALFTYAVFDVGAGLYWLVPTAPPWYAAKEGAMGEEGEQLRRLMYEHGEAFWKGGWRPLYDFLGGNPLAAMPSLHFATSVMAAHVLGDAGRVPGAVGWAYAGTLGFSLVYLGEHYLIDLLAGLALTEAVRRKGPAATGLLRRIGSAVQSLERLALAPAAAA